MKLIPIHRVSTQDQAGSTDEGLDRQRTSTRAIAAAHGATLLPAVEIIDVSGSDVALTPEWGRVLTLIASPDTHIAVDAIDRLLRAESFNFKVFQDLVSSGTRVFTPGRVYDLSAPEDGFMTGLLALLGGREKAEVKRRAMAGREAMRRRGEWAAKDSALPRGCSFDRQTRRWSYTPDAEVIRRAFLGYGVEGRPAKAVARDAGCSLQALMVYLRNDIYRGLLRFDEKRGAKYATKDGRQADRKKVRRADHEVIEVRVYGGQGQEPQLVSDEVWAAVQARIRSSATEHTRRREIGRPEGWASGFLGSSMATPDTTKEYLPFGAPDMHTVYANGGGVSAPRRYTCRCGKGEPIARCGLGHPRADVVNRTVDAYLVSLTTEGWFVESVRATMADGSTDTQSRRAQIEDRLQGLDRREARLTDLYLDGRIDRARHDADQDKIRSEREALRRDLAALVAPTGPTEADLASLMATWTWDAAWPHERKREWLAKYVARIWIDRTGITGATIRVPGPSGGMPVYGTGHSMPWLREP